MGEVGIKALKDHLSEYLRRARTGERILITDRGVPVAVLAPVEEGAWGLVRSGVASWGGGKPKGSAHPPRGRGKMASEVILEDRR